MKTLLTKLLAAMLVACLLLTPVAMMEEAPVADAADAEVSVTASTDDAVPEAPADDDVEITPDAVDEAVPEEGASELDNTVLFEAGEVELDLGDDLTEGRLLFADEVTYSIDDEFDDPVLRGMVKGSLHISFTAPNATATSTQLAGVTSLTLPGLKSLKGIQLLTGLEDLYISGASLTSINLKNTAVQCISIGNCSNLKELDLSGCTNLRSLDCINNKLETLNVDNCPALVDLTCLGNRLKTLNVSTNTRLEKLNCYDNQLEKLNVSNNPDLQELECVSKMPEAHFRRLWLHFCVDFP